MARADMIFSPQPLLPAARRWLSSVLSEDNRCVDRRLPIEPIEPRVLFNGDAPVGDTNVDGNSDWADLAPLIHAIVVQDNEPALEDEPAPDEPELAFEHVPTITLEGYVPTVFYTVHGDFNGDDHLDFTNAEMIWLSNGDGTFQEGIDTGFDGVDREANPTVNYILAADFNGDGLDDVAFTTFDWYDGDEHLYVLLSNESGTFEISHQTPTARPIGIRSGDANGDGHADLVIDASYEESSLLLGRGEGTFQEPVPFVSGTQADARFSGHDFNGDGIADLIDLTDPGFTVRLGADDHLFDEAIVYESLNLGFHTSRYVAGDFDHDGHLDLAFQGRVEPTVRSVRIVFGNGDGSFGNMVSYDESDTSVFLIPGDYNGDGREDLLIGTGKVEQLPTTAIQDVFVVFNTASKDLELATLGLGGPLHEYFEYWAYGAADFDGDGRDDIIGSDLYWTSIDLMLSRQTEDPPAEEPPAEEPPAEEPPAEEPPVISASPPTIVGLDKMKTKLTESGKKAKFRVVREGDLSRSTKVKLNFGGKAKYGKDYEIKVSGGGKMKGKQLVIPKGKKALKVTVIPDDDNRREKDESIEIAVVQTAAVSLPTDIPSLRALFEGRIKDND
ncbi:MAG: FG-GAP-like repeat-containing protein [Planctomycetota bacterium]